MKNIYLLKHIKKISFLLFGVLLFAINGCSDDEQGFTDERYLANFEYFLEKNNPLTDLPYTEEELGSISYDPRVKEQYLLGHLVEFTLVSKKMPTSVKLLSGKDLTTEISSLTSFSQDGEWYRSEKFSTSLTDLGLLEIGDTTTISMRIEFEDGSIGAIDYIVLIVEEEINTFVYLKTSAGETIPLRISESVTSRTESPEYGNIVEFDGISDKVEITDNVPIAFRHSDDYSIGFWVNTTSPDSDPVMVGDQDWNSSNNPGLTIAHRGDNWRVARSDGSTKADINYDGAYNDGNWHHLMVTFDRDGNMTMYQDGASVASTNMSAVGSTDSGNNMFIGQDGTGGYGQFFQGKLSDVYIYDYVLTAEQVSEIVSNAAPATGAKIKYESGFEKPIEVINSGAVITEEEKGITFGFDGASQYATLDDTDLAFRHTSNYSVSFWVNTTSTDSDPVMIGDQNWDSSNNIGTTIAFKGDNWRSVITGSGGKTSENPDGSTFNDGDWHFLTVTYDRAGNMVMYQDGSTIATGDMSGAGDTDAGNPLRLAQDGPATYGQYFEGKIADVVIYDYALTPEQVTEAYTYIPPTGVELRKEDGSRQNLPINNNGADIGDEDGRITFTLDGSNYVGVDNTGLDFRSSGDFTIATWVNTTNGDSDPSIIGDKDWGSGGNKGFVIAYLGSDWKLNAGDGSNRVDITGNAINDGEWHLLTATFDRDGMVTIYQDGVALGSEDMSGVGDMNSGLPINIGQDGTGSYGDWFTGKVANSMIFDYALSAEQVTELYNE